MAEKPLISFDYAIKYLLKDREIMKSLKALFRLS
jgi:hypothetical protein